MLGLSYTFLITPPKEMKTDNQKNSSQFTLRNLLQTDMKRAMFLKESAGWNQLLEDWHTFLKLNPEGCFVAVQKELVVGTGTCLNFDSRIGWIAMILVDPEYRRKGIGKKLMDRSMEHLANCESIKLDATSQGRQLYIELGFHDEFEINRYLLNMPQKVKFETDKNLSPIDSTDLPQIKKLDKEAFGAERKGLVEDFYNRGREFGFKYVFQGEIKGFILGRRGSQNAQLGPIVAKSQEIAGQLVRMCLNNIGEKQVVLDVPASQEQWLNFLENMELSKQRWFMRMYKGKRISGNKNILMAIAGPDFG